jgi:hypothetical protein
MGFNVSPRRLHGAIDLVTRSPDRLMPFLNRGSARNFARQSPHLRPTATRIVGEITRLDEEPIGEGSQVVADN